MRGISICILSLCCLLIGGRSDAAWAWGEKPLVAIDGQEYSVADYQEWWKYWRDSERQPQESVQPFVDWMLMVREAERMDLASLPEFKRKVDIFVQARALMMLKHDEVDSKIVIKDDALQAAYTQQYSPRRLVGSLEFSSMNAASDFVTQQAGEPVSLERLQALAEKKPAPPFVLQRPQWLRPIVTPLSWSAALNQAEPGGLLGPLPIGDKAELLYLLDVKSGDHDDYERKKEEIASKLRKQQEQVLTEQLVWSLREKFHVRVNDNVLEKINLIDPNDNTLDALVIDSDNSRVTVEYFLEQSRRETDITKKLPHDPEGLIRMKQRLVNAMITNSVVLWEALSRHYEEKEPLQGAYRFYRQNRLVVELVNRAPGDIQVSDREVQSYYRDHLEEYKHPEMIRGVMVAGGEPAIKKIWAQAIGGANLVKTAKENNVTVAISPEVQVPLQHFSLSGQKVLASLKTGDMSQPFLDNGQYLVIKLIERTAGAAAPFAMVSGSIKDKLVAEKKAKRRQALVEALRSRSKISVNEEAWATLLAEKR